MKITHADSKGVIFTTSVYETVMLFRRAYELKIDLDRKNMAVRELPNGELRDALLSFVSVLNMDMPMLNKLSDQKWMLF